MAELPPLSEGLELKIECGKRRLLASSYFNLRLVAIELAQYAGRSKRAAGVGDSNGRRYAVVENESGRCPIIAGHFCGSDRSFGHATERAQEDTAFASRWVGATAHAADGRCANPIVTSDRSRGLEGGSAVSVVPAASSDQTQDVISQSSAKSARSIDSPDDRDDRATASASEQRRADRR